MPPSFQPALRLLARATATAAIVVALGQCAHETPVIHRYEQPRLGPSSFVTTDHQNFGYRKWTQPDREPETIVIGLHGFCGAAIDYENLGDRMLADYHHNDVYAYEIRGQGNDPVRQRRGDIPNADNWFADLLTFTSLIRKEHPHARIVWFGESMGALIAAHAYQRTPPGTRPPCDALVLASPIVTFRDDFPEWKKIAVRVVAYGFPKARLSLETLAGGQPVPMTSNTVFAEQAETNSWHVERHTLRLLVTLSDLIDGMSGIAPQLKVPTLVMYGGKDFFSRPEDVAAFYQRIPAGHGKRRLYYPDSHHLLMYDQQRDRVIADAAKWIDSLRNDP